MLRAHDLSKSYRRVCVLERLNLELGAGEVVGLLGPNGAGKTTCFALLCGLLRLDQGEIWLGEEEISHWPAYRRARAGLGYLHQEPSVFRQMTVKENVLTALELAGEQRKGEEAERLLASLGIAPLARRRADHLSGGERRRLEIARCLALRPRLLLLDEPFAALDPRTVSELQETIQALARQGIAILISDHNVRETLQICRRAYILEAGRLLASGTRQNIVDDPCVRAAYLGEHFSLPA